jgi:hypothetical protein
MQGIIVPYDQQALRCHEGGELVFPRPRQIVNGGEDLDSEAVHERHINRVWRPLQESLDYSRINSHSTLSENVSTDNQSTRGTEPSYLDIKRGAGHSERRIAQLWRASHVLSSLLAEEDTLNLTTTIGNPEMRTLLLIQVVDHDLVLDVVEEHGATI